MTLHDQQAAMVAPSFHVIRESVLDVGSQLVRCRCGRSAVFTGGPLEATGRPAWPHKLAEFTCDGETVMLRRAALRPL